MKLSILNELLIEKNNKLPESQRRVSSVRNAYKKVNFLKTSTKNNESSDKKSPNLSIHHDNNGETEYNQSNNLSELKSEIRFQTKDSNNQTENVNKIDKIKIIGITGSRGKSTTAFLVHQYLEAMGYKSILYSSIKIKSPVSYIDENASCEIPLQNENTLLDIIEEAKAYEADYIVLEVNESAIEKGLVKEIPFSIRALTNIIPYHNDEQYSEEEYSSLKKSFFIDIPEDEECTCVLGLTSFSREEFNSLLSLNNHPKVTYGTKYICEVKNANYTNLDCLLHSMNSSIDGLDLKIRVKDTTHDIKTNIILPHNALNITCTIAILEALKIFDPQLFNKTISNINIPGREEVIRINNRTIVIGLSLIPALENFKTFKKDATVIKKIKILTASVGTGFVSWDKSLSSKRYLNKRSSIRRFCMKYVKENADFAYITSNDNAAEDPLSIATEMQGYLNNEIPSVIVVDREEAIRRAITESEPFDLIYISGRGNRRIFCDSANTVKLFQDKEVVEQVLKDLKW